MTRSDLRDLKLLVAIASYGESHMHFLKEIIATYQRLPMQVRVVVFSEAPKDLGPGVEVVVGLPTSNPWSLPFAHKKLFLENVENYDLFIYTEDDISIGQPSIEAFLRLTAVLEPEEIAGFQLYEVDPKGTVTLPGVHGPFHWKLDSVRHRGGEVVAEFTNEHSACYMITKSQLRRAIQSGGFGGNPFAGRFDMLCSAGTDVYTTCGFRKVMSISAIDDFLLHHLPNRYAGRVGVTLELFKAQIRTLIDVHQKAHPFSILCEVETRFRHRVWSKIYYGGSDHRLLSMVPPGVPTVLSVGCGLEGIEPDLVCRGAHVTALPLDSVIGAISAGPSIEMVYAGLEEGLKKLEGKQFDCVLITDILHLQKDPWQVLKRCAGLVKPGGAILIQSPNFNYLPVLVKRSLNSREMRKLRTFADGGVTPFSLGCVSRRLKGCGFDCASSIWFNRPHFNNAPPRSYFGIRKYLGRLMAEDWVLRMFRTPHQNRSAMRCENHEMAGQSC